MSFQNRSLPKSALIVFVDPGRGDPHWSPPVQTRTDADWTHPVLIGESRLQGVLTRFYFGGFREQEFFDSNNRMDLLECD